MSLKDKFIGTMTKELTHLREENDDLRETLRQIKSQLLDTYSEDSVIITIINNKIK